LELVEEGGHNLLVKWTDKKGQSSTHSASAWYSRQSNPGSLA